MEVELPFYFCCTDEREKKKFCTLLANQQIGHYDLFGELALKKQSISEV